MEIDVQYGRHPVKSEHALILIELAEELLKVGELPIAAVVLSGDQVVSCTQLARRRSRLDHAELVALKTLDIATDGEELTMLSTVEPCLMCYGAAWISSIRRIDYWLRAAGDGVSAVIPTRPDRGPVLHRDPGVPTEQMELLRTYNRLDGRRSTYAGSLLLANCVA
jgi:tRNA(adenine34) deaminase